MPNETTLTARRNSFAGVDPKVTRAYQAALDAFGSGNWDATITSCAKALEIAAKSSVNYNDRAGTLGQLLERLPKQIRMEQPLLDLSNAVKDNKGLGAHFDLEKEANGDIALATLELVEAFVTYFYVFKDRVDSLIQMIEKQSIAMPSPSMADQEEIETKPSNPQLANRQSTMTDAGDGFERFDTKSDFNKKERVDIGSGGWK
jgi:hypothetical protein